MKAGLTAQKPIMVNSARTGIQERDAARVHPATRQDHLSCCWKVCAIVVAEHCCDPDGSRAYHNLASPLCDGTLLDSENSTRVHPRGLGLRVVVQVAASALRVGYRAFRITA